MPLTYDDYMYACLHDIPIAPGSELDIIGETELARLMTIIDGIAHYVPDVVTIDDIATLDDEGT